MQTFRLREGNLPYTKQDQKGTADLPDSKSKNISEKHILPGLQRTRTPSRVQTKNILGDRRWGKIGKNNNEYR